MKAIVVYESHWGNTAAVARAIAEGLGPEAQTLSTAEATGAALADVDLIVAGSPLLGFSLPTEGMLKSIAANASKDPVPPDLAHPSMRAWLAARPKQSCAGWRRTATPPSTKPRNSLLRISTARCAPANWSGPRRGAPR